MRIVCATNRDPAEEVRAGRFREDLYYRLHVVPIHMPPLRARPEDILEIAQASLRQFAAEEGKTFTGFDAGVAAILTSRPWPGNVRQLLNVVRNIVVLHDGPLVTAEMLPVDIAPGAPAGVARAGCAAAGAARRAGLDHPRPGRAARRDADGRDRARADRGDDRPLRRLYPAGGEDARAVAVDDLPQARELGRRAAALGDLTRRRAPLAGSATDGRAASAPAVRPCQARSGWP